MASVSPNIVASTSTAIVNCDSADDNSEIDVLEISDIDVTSSTQIEVPDLKTLFAAKKFPTSTRVNNPKMKNAGRKKSNPAWEFFEDLRPKGVLGVRCKFCSFYTEDRSPTILKFHIKRFHDTGAGGLWHQLNEIYNWQIPHKYASNKTKLKAADVSNGLSEVPADGPLNIIDSVSISSKSSIDKNELGRCEETAHNNNESTTINSNIREPLEFNNISSDRGKILEFNCPNSYKSELPKAAMCDRAIDLSQRVRPKNANNWTYLGTFHNEEDMHKIRIREKVSKRRTEQLKNGVKVRYRSFLGRCNKWKRTKCGFQMFALFANDKIDLYETGMHDHTGERMKLYLNKLNGTNLYCVPNKIKKSPTQMEILENLLKQPVNEREVVTITAYNNDNNTKTTGLEEPSNFYNETCTTQQNLSAFTEFNVKLHENERNNTNVECNKLEKNIDLTVEDNEEENILKKHRMYSSMGVETNQKLAFTNDIDSCNVDDDCLPLKTVKHCPKTNIIISNGISRNSMEYHCKKAELFTRKGFLLGDTTKLAQLLEIASDLNLTLSLFNRKGILEYMLYSKAKSAELAKRSIVISELEPDHIVRIQDLCNSNVIYEERWLKADWPQFLWAIRGKCAHFLSIVDLK